MKRIYKLLTLCFLITSLTSSIISVSACTVGLTPGYWKNHHCAWPSKYTPDMLFQEVFDIPDQYIGPLKGITLDEALRLKGGRGIDGAKRIFARQVTASLLNSALFEPQWEEWTLQTGQWVFTSDDREFILDQAKYFDESNNQGPPEGWTSPCPAKRKKCK